MGEDGRRKGREMAVNWTREQKQVIDGREKSLLVSAAAGSGKTAVLVERIIQMITEGENPKDIDRLLVMTFTRAAAAEMRERIQAAIEKKLESEPENEHLQQQAVLVQFAQITTIDSFCLHIMREHFDRLDIDPAFRVGDEGEMLLMRADVMDELLEDYYRDGGERYEKFVDAYATGKADGGIAEYVMQVYNFAQSNPWPDAWYEKCRGELLLTEQGELDQTEWMQFLLRDIALQAQEWKTQLREAWEICQETGGPMPYLPMIEEDLRHAEAVCGAADSFEAISGALEQFTFSRLAAIRGKNGEVDPEKKALVSDCRSRVKKAVEKLKGEYLFASPEQMLEDLEAGKERILELLELSQEFGRRFRAKKKEKNVVDFHDLEHFALEILTEPEVENSKTEENSSAEDASDTEKASRVKENSDAEAVDPLCEKAAWTARIPGTVADELAMQYDEILVDEYQDSNLVQETLIQCISGERFGRPNVFMVGDVKQSIYKFRLARPELFLEKYRTYTSEESTHQKIELHQNFRSREHVLESINTIFYRIMTEKLGNISYTEDAALHPGAVFEERDGLDELKTELLLVDLSSQPQKGIISQTVENAAESSNAESEKTNESAGKTSGKQAAEAPELDDEAADYTARELEARMIAGKIREMTGKEHGITIWDKELGAYRRAQYGDIVILLRSVSGWAEEFIEVLATQGIPAVAESRTGYFNTLEVETVLNLLAVIDNPMQDIPLASVLKSPFGGISDEEMAWIVAEHKAGVERSRDAGLYRAVVEYMEEKEIVEETADKEGTEQAEFKAQIVKMNAGTEDLTLPQKNKLIQKNNLRQKLQKLFALLDTFRQESVYLPMHELLYRIYDKTGYYRYVSALPGGAGRRGNLDMLVEKAAAYEATSYRGVFHFIRYIEKLKKYNTDFGEAPVADSEGTVVRIMSIHKSKGLEFPIVFVAGMGKNFNKQDTRGKLLIDADLGIGTDYLDSEKRIKGPTLKKNVMKRRMELEALGEELRVLYVALTRAKEKLILTASSRKLEDRIAKWSAVAAEHGAIPYTILTLASSYLDWILMSIPEENPWISYETETLSDQIDREIGTQIRQTLSREWLRWLAGEKELGETTFEVEKSVPEVVPETVSETEEREGSHSLNDGNRQESQKRLETIRQIESFIRNNYHFQYPYPDDLRLNTKMSVSELKKKGMEEEEEEMAFLPTLPVFMEKEQEEKGGATRGTAYHRVLQLLPFERAMSRQELNAFPAKLAAEGRMETEAAALVRGSDLGKLTASPLGKRMQRAAAAGKLYREKQFVIGVPAREMGEWDSDERILIQGIIDAFFEENGKLILVDYKTDYVENPDILIHRYEAQVRYYTRALEQMTGKKVTERYLYSFRFGAIEV